MTQFANNIQIELFLFDRRAANVGLLTEACVIVRNDLMLQAPGPLPVRSAAPWRNAGFSSGEVKDSERPGRSSAQAIRISGPCAVIALPSAFSGASSVTR